MRDGLLEERDLLAARDALGGAVHRTPLLPSASLSALAGNTVLLKAELFQKTGSFKARGLLYRLLCATDEERARGFVSISAGNAAAALAWAAKRLGSRATIVMRHDAVRSKVEATEAYGGEVVYTEGDYMGTCDALRAERGLVFVHPFDDPAVIAGHGGVGLEILDDADELDAIVVPVGGGGLIAGVAAAVKAFRPVVQVVGVEPTGADAMTRSLASGRVETLDGVETIADGLAAPFAGEHTLRHVQALVDRVVRVEDADIVRALGLIWTRCKLAAEPSAAASLAALLAGATDLRDRTVACVISGGNVNPYLISRFLAPKNP